MMDCFDCTDQCEMLDGIRLFKDNEMVQQETLHAVTILMDRPGTRFFVYALQKL